MATGLPKKLKKEPLIDAVFELRFSSQVPASIVLPGLLFEKLEGGKSIRSLPVSQLPKPLRDSDPNLKFAPLSRIEWGNFFVSVSDSSVAISSKYPYSGWNLFKPAITRVVQIVAESNIIDTIERYSMKYVDMLQSLDAKQKVSMINCGLSIAGHSLEKEPFQLRIEIPRDGFINAVQVASSAQAELHDGTKMEGLIIDVDSFPPPGGFSTAVLLENFSEKLEAIHQTNKAMFFDCLTPEAITSLEPEYE